MDILAFALHRYNKAVHVDRECHRPFLVSVLVCPEIYSDSEYFTALGKTAFETAFWTDFGKSKSNFISFYFKPFLLK
jgi:hypothetical protein